MILSPKGDPREDSRFRFQDSRFRLLMVAQMVVFVVVIALLLH